MVLSINRIINNLIDNSIKYSNNQSTIQITLKRTGDTIQFSVKDDGAGIPVNLQKKVFEPYYQITNPKTNSQGMGLGLPIVKKVIDKQVMAISNSITSRGEVSIKRIRHCAFKTRQKVNGIGGYILGWLVGCSDIYLQIGWII